MKYIFSLLVFSIITLKAQAQNCPIDYTLVCTNQVNYSYDAVGNRVARSQYCSCVYSPPNGGRYAAGSAKDSLKTLNNAQPATGIIALYPNPTTNSVTVEFASAVENAAISVSNSVGQTIATFQVSGKTATIDLNEQPAGVYLLTLLEGNARQTQRIVKAK